MLPRRATLPPRDGARVDEIPNDASPERIEIARPDDWHLHLRDGALLGRVVGATARCFRRAIVMPNLDPAKPVATLRHAIYGDLERVRLLRNRIAHHEPIFARALADDYQTIVALVTYRCAVTAAWLDSNQTATAIIAAKP